MKKWGEMKKMGKWEKEEKWEMNKEKNEEKGTQWIWWMRKKKEKWKRRTYIFFKKISLVFELLGNIQVQAMVLSSCGS
jgi:hypothetical protein